MIVNQLAYIVNIFFNITNLFILFKFLLKPTKKKYLSVLCIILMTTCLAFFIGDYIEIVGYLCLYLFYSSKELKGFNLLFYVSLASVISTCSIVIVSITITSIISLNQYYGIFLVMILNSSQLIIGLFLSVAIKKIMEIYPVNQDILPYVCLLLIKLDIIFMLYVVIGQSMKILALFATGTLLFMSFEILFFISAIIIIWNKLKKQYNQQLEQEKLKNLNEYALQLEKKQLELKKFKHDYKNLLLSIKNLTGLEDRIDMELYLCKLENYSIKELDKCEIVYSDIINIRAPLLKNLLLNKFLKWKEEDIVFNFECQKNFVYEIDFDILRVIGILLDNAFEEMIENKYGEINVLIYEEDKTIEVLIENTCEKKVKHFSKLSEKNYTSKENHAGLGLTIVREIVAKKGNVLIQQELTNGMFVVKLIIFEEGVRKPCIQ